MSINPQEKAAARTGLRAINKRSIEENVEYFFLIYKNGQVYGATLPRTSGLPDGIGEHVINAAMQSVPKGARVTACAHTHGKDIAGSFSLIFSPEDIKFANDRNWNSYLATPSNELVMLDHTNNQNVFPREEL